MHDLTTIPTNQLRDDLSAAAGLPVTLRWYGDGGMLCRTNPCPKGVYWSCYLEHPRDPAATRIWAHRHAVTDRHTNNDAEYLAVIGILELTIQHYPDHPVLIHSDSKLVVNTYNREWGLSVERLRAARAHAWLLARRLPMVEVVWVPRSHMVSRLGH